MVIVSILLQTSWPLYLGVADNTQRDKVDDYIQNQIVQPSMSLLPAFHPVITPLDLDWQELQMGFSFSFKNHPYEFQNGGLWPILSGLYVADLAMRGKQDMAERYLKGIDQANALPMNGEAWSFPEYVHGKRHIAGGTPHLGWSAAAAIIGYHALQGKVLLKISKYE